MNDNYEAELDQVLLDALKKMYSISNSDYAYKILLMRFLIESYDKKNKPFRLGAISRDELSQFLIKELNLPLIYGKIYYKGELIKTYPSATNSLYSILENWDFRYMDKFKLNSRGDNVLNLITFEEEMDVLIIDSKCGIPVTSRDSFYEDFLKNNAFGLIARNYKLKITPPGRIEGFLYSDSHNDFKLTLDEAYERLANANSIARQNTKHISERTLELFLMGHLDLIEDGLTLISNQYIIDGGRIDILARDKDGTVCILELKVDDDTDLVYQSIYYPIMIKEKFNTDNVRMITVAKKYPDNIKLSLETIKGIEMYIYNYKLENSEIKSMNMEKIS